MSAEKTERTEPSFYEVKTRKGILAWILSTDHKRIGLLYLYSIMTFFIVGSLRMESYFVHPTIL